MDWFFSQNPRFYSLDFGLVFNFGPEKLPGAIHSTKILVQDSMDWFRPTGKVWKKLVHLWGGPLFPVGPVGILVEWMAPTGAFEKRASGSANFTDSGIRICLHGGENRGIVTCSHGTRVLTWKIEGKNSKTLEWKLHLNVGFLRSEAWFNGGPIYLEKKQEKVGADNVKIDEALKRGWELGKGGMGMWKRTGKIVRTPGKILVMPLPTVCVAPSEH